MKTSPPWSRRLWTQPATRTSESTLSGRTWPHQVSRYSLARRAGKPSLMAGAGSHKRGAPRLRRRSPPASAADFLGDAGGIDLPLLARAHVARGGRPLAGEDQRIVRADPVRLPHLPLRRPVGQIEVGSEPSPAKLCDEGQGP